MTSLFSIDVDDETTFGIFRSSLENYIASSDTKINLIHLQELRAYTTQLDILQSSLLDPYAKAYDRSVFIQILKDFQERFSQLFSTSAGSDGFDELYKAFSESKISQELVGEKI